MESVELREQGVWVVLDVVVVVLEDVAEEFVFALVDGLDDVFVVAGEVEEAFALSGRTQL
jgi:hypothetical protein